MKNNDLKIKVDYKENKLLNIFYKLINKKDKVNSSAFLWFENENIKCWDIPPRIELLLNVTNEKNCELFWIVKNPNKNKRIALEIGEVGFKLQKPINKTSSEEILENIKKTVVDFCYTDSMSFYDNYMSVLIHNALSQTNLRFYDYDINYFFVDEYVWNEFKYDLDKSIKQG